MGECSLGLSSLNKDRGLILLLCAHCVHSVNHDYYFPVIIIDKVNDSNVIRPTTATSDHYYGVPHQTSPISGPKALSALG